MYTFRDLRHNSPSLSQHRFSLCEYHGSTGWDSSTNKSLHMAVGEREGLSRAIQGLFSTFFSASWKEWKNIIQRNMAFTLTLCSPWVSLKTYELLIISYPLHAFLFLLQTLLKCILCVNTHLFSPYRCMNAQGRHYMSTNSYRLAPPNRHPSPSVVSASCTNSTGVHERNRHSYATVITHMQSLSLIPWLSQCYTFWNIWQYRSSAVSRALYQNLWLKWIRLFVYLTTWLDKHSFCGIFHKTRFEIFENATWSEFSC